MSGLGLDLPESARLRAERDALLAAAFAADVAGDTASERLFDLADAANAALCELERVLT